MDADFEAVAVQTWRSEVFDELLLRLDDGIQIQIPVVLKGPAPIGSRVRIRRKSLLVPGVTEVVYYEFVPTP